MLGRAEPARTRDWRNAMTPLSRRWSLVAAALAFAFVLIWFSGSVRGRFRIDEAHKISETRALALLLEGRCDDPEWFANIVDRTNPPVGKYLFGLAALAAGVELPRVPSLARAAGEGDYIPPQFSDALSEPYRPLLVPARTASLVATALTGALVVFVAARSAGGLAAAVALLLYVLNFLTATFAATAVFDPLLTFFVFASAAAALTLWSDERPRLRNAVLAGCGGGVAAALAFQTRATGLIALVIALSFGVVRPLIRREARVVAAYAIPLLLVFGLLSVSINPYYWGVPEEGRVPPEFAADAPLPARVIERVALQARDLSDLLARTRERTATLSGFAERSRFFVEVVAGDVQGLLLFLGVSLAIVLVGVASVARLSAAAAVVYLSLAVTVGICGWLPVAWPRYLLVTVPFLAASAGVGWASLWRAAVDRRRRRG